MLQIRIVVGTPDADIATIDGGAFLEYLQRQEEEALQGPSTGSVPARVAVIGHNFKPIPSNLEAPELSGQGTAATQATAGGIVTPSYTNLQSNSGQGTGQ